MQFSSMSMIFLALLAVCEAVSRQPKINPPLHDGNEVSPGAPQSDKKFFGPPFPADYPEDKRPVADKHILDKLKGPEQPYPALQSKADYDADFVKDENSDTGAWQAQFEYDALRKKLAQEQGDVRRAEERAAREGRDVDGAQRDDDAANGRVRDAQKGDDDAAAGEENVKTADDFAGPPSDEKLKELKKAVEAAEERLEQQKKAFEKCKQELEDAKKNLEELKAQHDALEKQLAADTKLWEEKKAVKLNLKKTRQSDAAGKIAAAKGKLAAA
jgi:DNA repair exonuclease SbcCD ATPase subunit